MIPERMAFGQRFGRCDIQKRAAQMAGINRAQQIGLVDHGPTGGIDDCSPLGQGGKRVAVQDIFGLGRARQKADQDIGLTKKLGKRLFPGIGRNAFNRLHRAAPARHGEAEIGKRCRNRRAQRAKPHDTDPALRNARHVMRGPVAICLLGTIDIKVAHEMQGGIKMILHHLISHSGILKPNNRQVGWQTGRGNNMIHPRPKREDRLELRKRLDQALWLFPEQGIINCFRIVIIFFGYDIGVRQAVNHHAFPLLIIAGSGNQNVERGVGGCHRGLLVNAWKVGTIKGSVHIKRARAQSVPARQLARQLQSVMDRPAFTRPVTCL